jgi:hypothetical protein
VTPAREAVANTPRVLGIVLCDMAIAPDIGEQEAITLENVRERAPFPRFDPLHVYLQLYYWPGGSFTGEVHLWYEGRLKKLQRFRVLVAPGGGITGLWVGEIGPFQFPGRYDIEVCFWYEPAGHHVVRGERAFDLIEEEEI